MARVTPVSVSRIRNLNRTLLAVACACDVLARRLVRVEDGLVELAFRIAAAADLDLRRVAICDVELRMVYSQYIQVIVVSTIQAF